MKSMNISVENATNEDWRPTDGDWAKIFAFISAELEPGGDDACDHTHHTVIVYSPAAAALMKGTEDLENTPAFYWGWSEPGFGFGSTVFINADGAYEGEEQ